MEAKDKHNTNTNNKNKYVGQPKGEGSVHDQLVFLFFLFVAVEYLQHGYTDGAR